MFRRRSSKREGNIHRIFIHHYRSDRYDVDVIQHSKRLSMQVDAYSDFQDHVALPVGQRTSRYKQGTSRRQSGLLEERSSPRNHNLSLDSDGFAEENNTTNELSPSALVDRVSPDDLNLATGDNPRLENCFLLNGTSESEESHSPKSTSSSCEKSHSLESSTTTLSQKSNDSAGATQIPEVDPQYTDSTSAEEPRNTQNIISSSKDEHQGKELLAEACRHSNGTIQSTERTNMQTESAENSNLTKQTEPISSEGKPRKKKCRLSKNSNGSPKYLISGMFSMKRKHYSRKTQRESPKESSYVDSNSGSKEMKAVEDQIQESLPENLSETTIKLETKCEEKFISQSPKRKSDAGCRRSERIAARQSQWRSGIL